MDRALPFGLRSAPKLFTAVADAIAWTLFFKGVPYLLHYLDDFLFLGAPGSAQAQASASLAMDTLKELGVPVAHHKTEGPTTCLTFLGITVDTQLSQLRLPKEKATRLLTILADWRDKRSCTRKQLESLLGHLAHAAIVVRPGRIFLCPLFALLSTAARPQFFVRINSTSRADLAWWEVMLHHWNGISFFPLPLPSVHVFSDASGTVGCGAVNPHGVAFQIFWPATWEAINIATKELLPVVVASAMWGRNWSGSHVCFHVDNTAAVSVLQTRSARDPQLAQLLRCLFFYSAVYHFQYSAVHIPGPDNLAADALSRNQLPLFFHLYPQVQLSAVPRPLLDFLVYTQPNWGSPTWRQHFSHSLATLLPPLLTLPTRRD